MREEDGKLYVCDDIIYPKMISRLFGIDMKMAVELLEDLSKKGFLCRELRFYCSHCEQLVGPSFKTFNSLPNFYCCEECGSKMNNTLEDVVIVYRKLH